MFMIAKRKLLSAAALAGAIGVLASQTGAAGASASTASPKAAHATAGDPCPPPTISPVVPGATGANVADPTTKHSKAGQTCDGDKGVVVVNDLGDNRVREVTFDIIDNGTCKLLVTRYKLDAKGSEVEVASTPVSEPNATQTEHVNVTLGANELLRVRCVPGDVKPGACDWSLVNQKDVLA